MSASTDPDRHRSKMERRKAVQDQEVASKTVEKGLLIVHTGAGKGKSTAAFGLLLRTVGRGRRAAVVQFIKGAWSTGERTVLEGFGSLVEWHTMGEGFTWDTQDRERDVAACRAAWEVTLELLAGPTCRWWCWTSSTSRCATTTCRSTRCWTRSRGARRCSTWW